MVLGENNKKPVDTSSTSGEAPLPKTTSEADKLPMKESDWNPIVTLRRERKDEDGGLPSDDRLFQ